MSGEPNIKVMTLNVGRLFHSYPTACVDFLLKPEWDAACLQDLPRYVVDDARFRERWPVRHFVPMTNHFMRGGLRVHVGIGIFSGFPFVSTSAHAYVGQLLPVRDLDGVEVDSEGNARPTDLARLRETESRVAVFAEIKARGARFKIGTTHAPWVPRGQTDDHQRASARDMLSIIQSQGPLVIAGDFNAARGGEIYRLLTTEGRLEDCVPPEVVKTRDFGSEPNAPNLVVDYFFKNGDADLVSDVKVHSGVSDHYALSALVRRA
jgi:hypothetical protein